MSFILDALKKSEIERQRQTVPGLMETRLNPRRGPLPLWAVALCALLGVNLLVLTLVLWKRGAPAASAPQPAVASSAIKVDALPPVAEHFSPLDTAPVYAPEIPAAAAESPAPPRSPMDRGGRAGGVANAAVRSAHHADPLLTDENAGIDNQEILPSISEINLSGAQALPELHLDVHVYATNPAERFVYINMRKYHEGSPLQEGPLIERIRRDGVVLSYQGLRFLLPRQP
jgi:general secretion pathway protein B